MTAHCYKFTIVQIRAADQIVHQTLQARGPGTIAQMTESVEAALKATREPWALTMARGHDLQTRVANALRRLRAKKLVVSEGKAGRLIWRSA